MDQGADAAHDRLPRLRSVQASGAHALQRDGAAIHRPHQARPLQGARQPVHELRHAPAVGQGQRRQDHPQAHLQAVLLGHERARGQELGGHHDVRPAHTPDDCALNHP